MFMVLTHKWRSSLLYLETLETQYALEQLNECLPWSLEKNLLKKKVVKGIIILCVT